jgi:hypothetical protein
MNIAIERVVEHFSKVFGLEMETTLRQLTAHIEI